MPGPKTKDEALAWIQAAMEAGRYKQRRRVVLCTVIEKKSG